MPKFHVLVDQHGNVLGTLLAEAKVTGSAPPKSFGFRPRPGQRMLEIEVDEKVASLEPTELHKRIKADHFK